MTDQDEWPLPSAFLECIGTIAVLWSAIEIQMEVALLRIQEINLSTGMVVSSELGFRSKCNLLLTAANEQGGIKSEAEAKALKNILKRIQDAYPKRNNAVHPLWIRTEDPNVATRKGIRAKGRLRVVDEPVKLEDLATDAREIAQIGFDLTAFMIRNKLAPKDGLENVP